MKNLKYLFLSAIVWTVFSSTIQADNLFSFSTDPQSVSVSQMSGPITVHSDAKVTETTYLDFTSSSPTGQFLTSTNKSLTGSYISTGDSNRSVYYEDSVAGDFVITVVISNKVRTPIATISQHIYIGQSAPGGESSDNTGTATTTTTTTSQTANSVGGNSSSVLSANSSPALLPSKDAPVGFQISAGRDRLTSVGNSLLFTVVPIETKGVSNTINYTWSFGDGSAGQSDTIYHAYKFPGEYSVVVNAVSSDQMAVDRLTVKVVAPQIALQKVDGGVEVANNSAVEINLEGWSLVSGNKSFTFPKDTLIPAGRKVIFADDLTLINTGSLEIKNPLGKTYTSISNPSFVMANNIASTSAENLEDISVSVSDVSQKVAVLQSEINPPVAERPDAEIAVTLPASSDNVPEALTVATNDTLPTTNNPDQSATIFLAPSSPGLITRIFSWPISGFNFIRNLFVEH